MTFSLTDLETKAAFVLVEACLDGMGGSRPGDLEYDEYTWVDVGDLTGAGFDINQAKGVYGSLSKKGFVEPEVDGPTGAVSTAGWRWLDTIWDEYRAQ